MPAITGLWIGTDDNVLTGGKKLTALVLRTGTAKTQYKTTQVTDIDQIIGDLLGIRAQVVAANFAACICANCPPAIASQPDATVSPPDATPPAADTTAPTINSTYPASGAIDVPVDANILVTFSEAVKIGSGAITIKKDNTTPWMVIDVGDAKKAKLLGNALIIDPAMNLDPASHYTVEVPGGAVSDLAGNFVTGRAFGFTTAAAP